MGLVPFVAFIDKKYFFCSEKTTIYLQHYNYISYETTK